MLCLLSADRPIHEIIRPNLLDQRLAMENQFLGMSQTTFTYDEYENIRDNLIKIIHQSLTKQDKEFLLSVKNITPNWNIYNFKKFPAVRWKLHNLQKLKELNPKKHHDQYETLKVKLDS